MPIDTRGRALVVDHGCVLETVPYANTRPLKLARVVRVFHGVAGLPLVNNCSHMGQSLSSHLSIISLGDRHYGGPIEK
jgi:hypothetical protein